jgi:hypothetical protein
MSPSPSRSSSFAISASAAVSSPAPKKPAICCREIEKLVHLAESGKMKGKGLLIMDPEQIKKEKENVGGKEMA